MLNQIPDIASTQTDISARLEKVGMSQIEVPIRLETPDLGQHMAMGKADAYVSVDNPASKGIHMSRLFISLQKSLESEVISFKLIDKTLKEFINSHKDISKSAHLNIRFDYPMRKKSLLSDHYGWRSYPVELRGRRNGGDPVYQLKFEVTYSSTCPCSAALARQLIQQKFAADFPDREQALPHNDVIEWLGSEEGILATPHGQRSKAFISLELRDPFNLSIPAMITGVEQALVTVVQATVKREDEQEFARLNGQNLMFAEDAVRRLKRHLEQDTNVVDFSVEAVHYESLHPHNAVAMATKDRER